MHGGYTSCCTPAPAMPWGHPACSLGVSGYAEYSEKGGISSPDCRDGCIVPDGANKENPAREHVGRKQQRQPGMAAGVVMLAAGYHSQSVLATLAWLAMRDGGSGADVPADSTGAA
ncbi:hypothetical protein GCM10010970_13740 [Silvimonas iriomotensis]|uniref:Uncharacterized protein n=1 Tax=Silvimonas iriomotensis TaxID=449662 RepID=A0ABQ2P851_9NEIS|nr:hypothetical protein GCM10010970_13740 [Silvimonas iriomotensis]